MSAPMTCEQFAEIHTDLIASPGGPGPALPTEVLDLAEQHLTDCHGCQQRLAAQAALGQRLARLRQTPPPPPPPDLERALRAAFRARRVPVTGTDPAPAVAPSPRMRWLVAGLALTAAAGLVLVWPHTPSLNPPARPAADVGIGREVGPARPDRPGQFRALRFQPDGEPPLFSHRARVELTGATAAFLGWPVSPDLPRSRIQAEVLYGEDGLALGVRLLPASFRDGSTSMLPHETAGPSQE